MSGTEQYVQTCTQCGLSRKEFHEEFGQSQPFAKHRHLCLGRDDSGMWLHGRCLICAKNLFSLSIEAVYKHYARHSHNLNEDHTVRDIHRDFHPEDYPDLDLNHHYGQLLTRQNVTQANKIISGYWKTFIETPAMIYHEVRDIRDYYREAFFDFFDVDPISLHGHVSDAANPFVLGSLLRHLENVFRDRVTPSTFGEDARVAVMEGSYGMGFGPLAYNAPCPWSSDAACGPKPVIVRMDSNTIQKQIKAAKASKCVALLVAIVRSSDGTVMTTAQWRAIIEACDKYRMYLVVDEAMTAIRCGAPFAHQLPDYKYHGRPDLVLFGKGIRTNGIAVDWRGVNFRRLGEVSLEDRVNAIILWEKRLTETAPPEILLQSWGTITLACKQGWPQRAIKIGQVLRNVLATFNIRPSSISGLHSLLWLSRHDGALNKLAVMSANAGNDYTRWLPLMDSIMTSEATMMTKVFGFGSRQHRKLLAAYLIKRNWWLGYCSVCGNAMETGDDRIGARERCMECFARPCDVCEPGEHVCQMMDAVDVAQK